MPDPSGFLRIWCASTTSVPPAPAWAIEVGSSSVYLKSSTNPIMIVSIPVVLSSSVKFIMRGSKKAILSLYAVSPIHSSTNEVIFQYLSR